MSFAPVALSSCSISVRDPLTTTPTGRLQYDVRLYPYGAISEFCDANDCLLGPDGQPLRGVGVDLYNVDQTVPATTPPAGYVNPLAVTASNELFVDLAATYAPVYQSVQVGGAFIESSQNLGNPISDAVHNPTGQTCRARRFVTVVSASIENPVATPATGSITVTSAVNNAGTEATATVDCADIATCDASVGEAVYRLSIDGADYDIVRAMSGGAAVASTTILLPDVDVAAGATNTVSIQPAVEVLQASNGRFPMSGGTVQVCSQLICPPPSTGVFTNTPRAA